MTIILWCCHLYLILINWIFMKLVGENDVRHYKKSDKYPIWTSAHTGLPYFYLFSWSPVYFSLSFSVSFTSSTTEENLFCCLLHDGFLLGLSFSPENGGDMFLCNFGWLQTDYTALHHRRWNSSEQNLSTISQTFCNRGQKGMEKNTLVGREGVVSSIGLICVASI
jgi:hypothetical protein